jgi:hypothetical protein
MILPPERTRIAPMNSCIAILKNYRILAKTSEMNKSDSWY